MLRREGSSQGAYVSCRIGTKGDICSNTKSSAQGAFGDGVSCDIFNTGQNTTTETTSFGDSYWGVIEFYGKHYGSVSFYCA